MPRDPIRLEFDHFAPPRFCWIATFGEYDLGSMVGVGETQGEAIADLMAQVEDDE